MSGSVQSAIGYARVSTDEQTKFGVSLDAQEERIRAYCAMRGLELVEIIREEGVSATVPLAERPEGRKLSGFRGHIVALKLDRLFRSAIDALRRTAEWDKQGVTLHLVDQGGQSLDTHSAMGRMFLTVLAMLAQFERDLIAERTASALQYKKRHLAVYGPIPYGFVEAGGELIPLPREAEMLAEMRAWRDAGWTLRKIAAELNARGVPCKRKGTAWYASTVGKILGNDIHSPKAA